MRSSGRRGEAADTSDGERDPAAVGREEGALRELALGDAIRLAAVEMADVQMGSPVLADRHERHLRAVPRDGERRRRIARRAAFRRGAAGSSASSRKPLAGPSRSASPDAARARSANARSRADWNRCSGRFSRQCRTMRSSAVEIGSSRSSRSGSAFRIAAIVSAAVARRNGRSSRQHLEEHAAEGEDVRPGIAFLAADLFRSHVADGSHHRTRLGVRRDGPRRGLREAFPSDAGLASPKSAIFAIPATVTRTFSGLRSR